jgi:hypothetical protein
MIGIRLLESGNIAPDLNGASPNKINLSTPGQSWHIAKPSSRDAARPSRAENAKAFSNSTYASTHQSPPLLATRLDADLG